jgi:hypothetical protein
MPFVFEDGTGKVDAVSFASVQHLRDYSAARGLTVTADDTAAQGLLVLATDWIVANFAEEWPGYLLFVNQGLPWPRAGIIDPATGYEYAGPWMPRELIKATCALAMEAQAGALWNRAAPNTPQVIERTVGPITTKYNPLNPSDIVLQRNFDEVRTILSPILTRTGFGITIGRA